MWQLILPVQQTDEVWTAGTAFLFEGKKTQNKCARPGLVFICASTTFFWEQQGCETSLRSLLSAVGVAAHSQSIVIRSQKGRETRPTRAKDAVGKTSIEIWHLLLAPWSAFILAVLKLSWV